MGDKIKMSNGVAEVEIEVTGLTASKLEELAIRLFNEVAPKGDDGKRKPAGFSTNGWSTISDHERDPDDE